MITELLKKTKKLFYTAIIILILPYYSNPLANPQGGVITHGNASISPSGKTLIINQTSKSAIIHWHSFNIDNDEHTHFNQPTNGITLNRIDPRQGVSKIFGRLSATGKIILVNQAGIYFGASAVVDVGGIIASTSDISDDNFLAENYIFDVPSQYAGSIINEGTINAAKYGLVAFIGTAVDNRGMIQTNLGTVVLASGNKFIVDFSGDGLINFVIHENTAIQGIDENGTPLKHSVSNSGKIIANGSRVVMAAKSAQNVLDNVINMNGIIEAKSVGVQNGEIILSSNESVTVSGKLIASGGSGENGGTVKILGKQIQVNDAVIDVTGENGGTVLIGGNKYGNGSELNANQTYVGKNVTLLADALNTGNGGDVVIWSNEKTDFYGNIFTRGGSQSGHGGWVEVSSKDQLNFSGQVDTSAAHGNTGTLLLDPKYLVIATLIGLPYVDTVNNLFSNNPAGTNTISPLTISLLNSNIVLQANSDVIFTDALSLLCNGCSLTVQAGRSILINNSITTNNGLIQMTANDTNAISANRATSTADNPSGDNETLLGNITMAAGTSLNAGNQDVILTINSTNSAPFSPGSVTVESIAANNLSITTPNSITVNGAISLAGSATLEATTGTITLNDSITTNGSGYSIVLSADRFINNAGSSALDPINGNFLVWSGNPANDDRGGIAYNFKQYNATYASTTVLGVNDGFLYKISPLITPILVGSVSKVYDTTILAALNGINYSYSGAIDGDTVVLNNPNSGVYNDKNVGINKNISVSGISILSATDGSAQVYGYQLSSSSASAVIGSITPATLTASLTGNVSKVYDTTTAATLAANNYLLAGVLGSDVVSLNNPAVGAYDTANVGINKLISVSGLALSGADAGNYQLASTATSGNIGTITPATLTANLTGSASKVYDTTTAATLAASNYLLTGVLGADVVTLNNPISGTYDTANVGINKLISVSGLTLSGASASNYQLSSTATSGNIGEITPATLIASLTGSVSKVYDTAMTATLAANNYLLTGVLGADVVTLNNPAAGTYDTANVGSNKLISVSGLSLSGASVSNYQLASTATSGNIGTITPATLTASLTGSVSKVYDTTIAAVLVASNYLLAGVLGSDVVNLNNPAAGIYDTANVGSNKLISVSGLSLSGASASNYQLASTATSGNIGEITPAVLTANLTGNVSKVYDTTTTATLAANNYLLAGILGGDMVALNNPVAGVYDTANVGTNKLITVSGLALSGADASNYQLASTQIFANIGTITAASNLDQTTTPPTIIPGTTTSFPPSVSTIPGILTRNNNVVLTEITTISANYFTIENPKTSFNTLKIVDNSNNINANQSSKDFEKITKSVPKNIISHNQMIPVAKKSDAFNPIINLMSLLTFFTAQFLRKKQMNEADSLSFKLRTALNSIKGYSQIIYKNKISAITPKQKEYMALILNGSNGILEELNKLETGNLKRANSTISYAIRTNLNSIMGFARMIYNEKIGKITTQEKRYIDFILEESKQILELIHH